MSIKFSCGNTAVAFQIGVPSRTGVKAFCITVFFGFDFAGKLLVVSFIGDETTFAVNLLMQRLFTTQTADACAHDF